MSYSSVTTILPQVSGVQTVDRTEISPQLNIVGKEALIQKLDRPITGHDAFQTQIRLMGFDHLFVRATNNIIYRLEPQEDGDTTVEPLINAYHIKCSDKNKAWYPLAKYEKGYDFLKEISKKDQIFYIANYTKRGQDCYIKTRDAINKEIKDKNINDSGYFDKRIQELLDEKGTGTRNVDFTGAKFLFVESDDKSIDEQWKYIDDVAEETGLYPHFVIESGGKSLHIYYKISEIIGGEIWEALSKKLIMLFSSDTKIATLSRQMRLAGFTRCTTGREQQIVYLNESAIYSVDEIQKKLDAIFPWKLTDERWRKYLALRRKNELPLYRKARCKKINEILTSEPERKRNIKKIHEVNADSTVSEVFPLIKSLSKEMQEMVLTGVGRGTVGREPQLNNISYALLHSKAVLDEYRIPHTDDIEEIAWQYAENCEPPLEDSKVWKHINKTIDGFTDENETYTLQSVAWHLYQTNKAEYHQFVQRFPGTLIVNNYETASDRAELAWRESAEFKRLEAEQEYFEEVTPLLDQQRFKEEYVSNITSVENYRWNKIRKFTPDITIDVKYVTDGFGYKSVGERDIIAINSGLGSGKTRWMVDAIKFWGGGSLNISSRNMLGIQTAALLPNGYHIHADKEEFYKNFNNTQASQASFVLCIDSIVKYAGKENLFTNKTVVIDELMGFINHSLNSHHMAASVRRQCLSILGKILKVAGRIVILDGHMSDYAANWIHELAGLDRKLIKVKNERKNTPHPINFVVGTIKEIESWEGSTTLPADDTENENIDYTDDSAMEALVLADKNKFAVMGDCKDKLTALMNRRIERDKDFHGLLITSDTIADPRVIEFLRNSDKAIADNQYQGIFYSPTAESGIDISIRNYFAHTYSFFKGNISASDCKQMLYRVRDENVIRYVSYAKYAIGLEQDKGCDNEAFWNALEGQAVAYMQTVDRKAVEAFAIANPDYETEEILNLIFKNLPSTNNKAATTNAALRSFERGHCRKCLIELLTEAGAEIQFQVFSKEEEVKEEVKDEIVAIRMGFSQKIVDSDLLREEEAAQIKANPAQTAEEKAAMKKYNHNKLMSGIIERDIYDANFVYLLEYQKRTLVAEMQRNFLFKNMAIATALNDEKFLNIIKNIKKTKTNEVIITDINFEFLKLKAMCDAGFDKLIEPGIEWSNKSEVIETVKKNIQSLKF